MSRGLSPPRVIRYIIPIVYTLDAARSSQRLTRTILTTDDPEIAEIGRASGTEVPFLRPEELAGDSTPQLEVIRHALDWLASTESYVPDVVVVLQPTAPMRRSGDIDGAIDLLINSRADSVVSVAPVPADYNPHWQFHIDDQELRLWTGEPLARVITRRQDLPLTYTRNGAVYALRMRTLEQTDSIYGRRCLPYLMAPECSVNINDERDLLLADVLLRQRLGENDETR